MGARFHHLIGDDTLNEWRRPLAGLTDEERAARAAAAWDEERAARLAERDAAVDADPFHDLPVGDR